MFQEASKGRGERPEGAWKLWKRFEIALRAE